MVQALLAEPARPDEWEAAFQLIFQQSADEEREGRVQNALRLLRQGELNPGGILVVRRKAALLGALVCLSVPGASGLVWPPQTINDSRQTMIEDRLLGAARVWLQQRGVKLVQALLPVHEAHLACSLERNGFRHIT